MKFLALMFVLAITPPIASGQTDPENEPCHNVDPVFLVTQLVTESQSVREEDKRILILMRSAEFVWEMSEKDARAYFTEAYDLARRFREKTIQPKPQPGGLVMPVPDFRFEVLNAIAMRDAVWAEKLADEIMAEFEKAFRDRNERDQPRDIALMLSLAADNVESNPDLAWYIFRRVMRSPIEPHWYHTLSTVAGKNASMADALYLELLSNYRNENPSRLLLLSAYPFGQVRIFGFDRYHMATTQREPESLNPELQRRFLETFFDRIAAYAANPQERLSPRASSDRHEPVYMVSALTELEPIVIAELPFMLPRLAAARALADSLLTEEMQRQMATRTQYNANLETSFDERFAAMEEADKEGKLNDSMIVNLIFGGNKSEDQFRRLESWLDRIREENVRKEATSYYWFLRSKLAIKEDRFPDARKFSARVPEIDHHALLAFELAEAQMKMINEVSSAYQTLADLGKTIRRTDDSATKAKLLLGLAALYQKLNPSFAMDELAESVRVMNRLENPDMSSTQIFRQIVGKDWASYAVFTIPGQGIEGAFEKIAETDFSLTFSNARAIEDKYLRTIAVLAAAKVCAETRARSADAGP